MSSRISTPPSDVVRGGILQTSNLSKTVGHNNASGPSRKQPKQHPHGMIASNRSGGRKKSQVRFQEDDDILLVEDPFLEEPNEPQQQQQQQQLPDLFACGLTLPLNNLPKPDEVVKGFQSLLPSEMPFRQLILDLQQTKRNVLSPLPLSPTPKGTDNEDAIIQDSSTTASVGTILAWVGTMFMNALFIALIAWGTFTNWLIGFVCAGMYAAVLLGTGFALKRRNGGRNSVLTSLLFFWSIVAIAVAGSYLPWNSFDCAKYIDIGGFQFSSQNGAWITNTSNLSDNVQNWWTNDNGGNNHSVSFVYLPKHDVTLFRNGGIFRNSEQETSSSTTTDNGEKLWKVKGGSNPVAVPDIKYPSYFLLVEDRSLACFVNNSAAIICTTNGEDIKTMTSKDEILNPRDLYYADSLIWFRADPPHPAKELDDSDLLYSVDPLNNSTDVLLYSRQQQVRADNDDESLCDENQTRRMLFTSFLYASALPSFVLALALCFCYEVPSMPSGVYLSLTWVMVCVTFIIFPDFDHLMDLLGWWFVVTSGLWLLALTLAHLTVRISNERLTWCINFAGLFYLVGMFLRLHLMTGDTNGDESYWRWAVLVLVGIIPLIVLSIITGRILLMVLASIGLMIGVWKLTHFVAAVADMSVANAPTTQFIVLTICGLVLGVFVYMSSKYQKLFQVAVSNWAETHLGRWRLMEI